MTKKFGFVKGYITAAALWAVVLCGTPARGQDLVPVGDITGGSSVFVFRTASKAAPKRYEKAKVVRTKKDRIETARKVSRQYVTLAKAAPRRERTQSVDPNDPRLPNIPRMSKDEASKLFAGVGEYYMDRDDFDHAIDFFRESVTLDKVNVRARSGLSEALALKGNDLLVKDGAGAARKFFQEALTYNPKNSPAYFGLAEIFSDLDEDGEAVKNYEAALANDKDLTEIYVPLGILYYQQGLIAKAEPLLTKAMATTAGNNDPQTQFFVGLIRYSQGKDTEALAAFQKAKTLDPTYAEAFYQTGETLLRMGKYKEALTEYRQAAVLKPNYFDAFFGLGSAYFELDDYVEAEKAYRQAVRLKNNSIEAYINLADSQRLQAKYNDAESNYNLAASFIQRKSDYSPDEAADVYSKIGFVISKQCAINARSGIPCRWDTAVVALEKAAAITGNTVDTANLGWAYYNSARTDIVAKRDPALVRAKLEKAKASLEKAAFSSPKFIEGPLLNLGMTLTDLGDYAGAVDALKRVVDKQPKWVFAINELGIAYRKQKNYKEAMNWFKKATDRDDKYVQAHYNFAEAAFQNGDIGEAQKAYNKVKQLRRPDLAGQLELISGGKLRG